MVRCRSAKDWEACPRRAPSESRSSPNKPLVNRFAIRPPKNCFEPCSPMWHSRSPNNACALLAASIARGDDLAALGEELVKAGEIAAIERGRVAGRVAALRDG